MANSQFVLYREDVSIITSQRPIREFSGSICANGLYLANDSNPSGSTLSTGYSGLYDNIYTSGAFVSVSTNYSMGIDLGTARSVKQIRIYDDGTTASGMFLSGSNSRLDVYHSGDNSNWTFVKSYRIYTRQPFSGSTKYATLMLPEEVSQRYWKCHCSDGGLKDLGGSLLNITEMQACIRPSGRLSSETTYVTHKATAVDTTLLPIGEDDEISSGDPFTDRRPAS